MPNPQPVGYFTTVGTYNPDGNRFTTIPDEWIVQQSPGWIMAGRHGVYEPGTGRLQGRQLVSATWADGSPVCTEFGHRQIAISGRPLLKRQAKPPPTLVGTPRSLPSSRTSWHGSFACDGSRYRMQLTIDQRDGGRLAGSLGLTSQNGDGASATVLLVGTHNPGTGRLTLGPTRWANGGPPSRRFPMYFVDGHFHDEPYGLVVRIVTGSGPCEDAALVRLAVNAG